MLHKALEAKITRVFCPKDGELVYSEPLEDHPTQVRAAEVVGKLRGDFPAHKTIERMELLRIQQNIVVVTPLTPSEERREKPVRQLED